MENREAIKIINQYDMNFHWNVGEPIPAELLAEAFDLAISALEFKGRYDQFWEEVKAAGMKGKETEIHHSGRVFRIREVAQ